MSAARTGRPPANPALARVLKKERLTLADLAFLVGVCPRTIHRWSTGRTRSPALEARVAAELKLTPKTLRRRLNLPPKEGHHA